MHSYLVDVDTRGNSLGYIRLAEFGNRCACLERLLITVKGQAVELAELNAKPLLPALSLIVNLRFMPYFTAPSTVSTVALGL